MGAENHDRVIRHLLQLVYKDRTAGAEVVDHMSVVHHFMTHINRTAKDFEGAVHNVDRAVHTGTEASGVGKYDVHQWSSAGSTCAIRTLK